MEVGGEADDLLLGAPAAAVFLPDDDRGRLRASALVPAPVSSSSSWRRMPVDEDEAEAAAAARPPLLPLAFDLAGANICMFVCRYCTVLGPQQATVKSLS